VPLGVKDAVFIVNPLAGGGRRMKQVEEARRIFRDAGIETELQPTTAPGHATELAHQAVAQARQLAIVCGGDGTVNEAVNGLACSQVPMAILPAGTANVLAKELSLPWNLPQASRLLTQMEFRRIALGLAVPEKSSGAPRYFISLAGAGPDGAIVSAVRPEIKLKAGIIAYWQEGFRQLTSYKFPTFRVSTNGQSEVATLVVIGRTKHYGGPFQITTKADLLGNDFELVLITTQSAWRYLGYLPLLFMKKLRGVKYVKYWRSTSLQCEATDGVPVLIQVDGEPAGRLPAEFRIVPDALTLAMPRAML